MNDTSIDWDTIHTIHMVGIKGVAMTSLSLYFLDRGMKVTGSDVKEDFPTKDVLLSTDISITEGFSPKHIEALSPLPDVVIYTGAHGGKENPEVVAAMKAGIPVLPHGKALGTLMKDSVEVSVAGSHGKTTTSAMIATILVSAGLDPSYAIGCGSIRPLGNPGHFGKGNMFVAEADEYMTDRISDPTPRFFWQNPDIFVVTNIDYDHPDAYASLSEVENAFQTVQQQEKGLKLTIVNADDRPSDALLHPPEGRVVTYGTGQADYRIEDIVIAHGKTTFSLLTNEGKETFSLPIPGIHNALNAGASIAACRALGVSFEDIRRGLHAFGGTKRRFEIIGEERGITIVDDYAHHPTEIEKTLSAAKSWFDGRRIIAVFQPHTFSRTRALFSEFASAFSFADIVLIAEIYASARESVDPTMSGERLVEETKKHHTHAYFKKTYRDVEIYLDEMIEKGDVIIFFGAGDIADWGRKMISHLTKKI